MALLAALIAYGPLYPFEFVWHPIGRTAEITDPLFAILIAYIMSRSTGRDRKIGLRPRPVSQGSLASGQMRKAGLILSVQAGR